MNEQRVLIFPPSRRDGEATLHVLQQAGLTCCICQSGATLAAQLDEGAGAIVLTDSGLMDPEFEAVLASLNQQPPWSDIPIVLLCHSGSQSTTTPMLERLTNATLLDRPTSARTLISAVQAAIRVRLRQYQARDQLEALKRAEEDLRNADRRKDEFLAMLAHELRNPLAPIRNASELLMRLAPENERMQSMAAIIKRQITQLTRLVDDLLDVSRITRGRIELQQVPVELSAVIAQAMESVEPLMRAKRHKVMMAVGYQPLYVKGDQARLVQCIANILTNSAKYTDPGGAIRIDVREEQSMALIAITDNGMGIPHELLSRIFDLFVQSDRSLDRSEGGLGIGLSVVRRLIEMHGGQVSASSDGLGHGATFEVRIPTIAPPAVAQEDPGDALAPSKRVLIVDDNADAGNSLAMILNERGHVAEVVYGSSDALKRVTEFNPEVVLLDIGLPGMDGYEVARRIRGGGCPARLVALTGYGQSEDFRRSYHAGFDAHLVKPVEMAELFKNLASR